MIGKLFPPGSRRRDLVYRAAYPLPARLSQQHTSLSQDMRCELEADLRRTVFHDRPEGFEHSEQGRRDVAEHMDRRLEVSRRRVVPWLDDGRSLRGATILEIGCGTGSSTVAFAEQGATVVGIDVVGADLELARKRVAGHGLDAEFRELNAVDVAEEFSDQVFDFIVFYASLEHMTHAERIAAMSDTWGMLRPGGMWAVVEAPNRLWYFDGHTSVLPFFHWLPNDLAFDYSRFSPREGFRETYRVRDEETMHHFLRRGRGVSYHEFELAMGPADDLDVVSSMFGFERRRNPALWTAWRASTGHRHAELLRRQRPGVHPGFFEETLYLLLRKA